MQIKAETVISKQVYEDLWKYNLLKKPVGVVVTTFGFLFSIFLFAFGILIRPYGEDEFLPRFFLVLGFVLFILLLLIIFVLPQLLYRKSVSTLAKQTQHFTFEQDFFIVHSEEGEEEGFSKIKYSSLNKIVETKQYFYIYITNGLVFIVCKNKFSSASPLQLQQLLQSSLDSKKYKIIR
jgi:hypothetical protein